MFSIVKWELQSRKWSIVWWIVGITAFITLNLSVYPSFRDQADQLNQTFNQMPQSVRDLFSDTGDFLSPVGYLSSQIFYLLLPLLFSFLSVGLGASLIAREEQRHTIELLLSRPISRGKLLFGKALAGVAVTSVVALVVGLVSMLEVALIHFKGVHTIDVLLVTLLSMLLSLLFGAIAFTLTSMGAVGRGASIGIAALFGIGGYVISSLDNTVAWLRVPAKLFPYHYFKPGTVLEGHFAIKPTLAFAGIIIVLAIIAWVAFRRRDIN